MIDRFGTARGETGRIRGAEETTRRTRQKPPPARKTPPGFFLAQLPQRALIPPPCLQAAPVLFIVFLLSKPDNPFGLHGAEPEGSRIRIQGHGF
jgi:hypothetical protein